MSEKPILEWTKVMCDLGYKFDAGSSAGMLTRIK